MFPDTDVLDYPPTLHPALPMMVAAGDLTELWAWRDGCKIALCRQADDGTWHVSKLHAGVMIARRFTFSTTAEVFDWLHAQQTDHLRATASFDVGLKPR